MMEERLGCSQEKKKLLNSGKTVARRPKRGPTPKLMNLSQNSMPSSPGRVLVRWLRVASRNIWE